MPWLLLLERLPSKDRLPVRNHLPANPEVLSAQQGWRHLTRSSVPRVTMGRALDWKSREWVLPLPGLDMNSLWTLGEPLPLSRSNFTQKMSSLDQMPVSMSCILWFGIKRPKFMQLRKGESLDNTLCLLTPLIQCSFHGAGLLEWEMLTVTAHTHGVATACQCVSTLSTQSSHQSSDWDKAIESMYR